jgi:hypothetical protein
MRLQLHPCATGAVGDAPAVEDEETRFDAPDWLLVVEVGFPTTEQR